MNPDNFKHSVPVQIRFSDVDRVNHVNNAVYLTYMELGRVHYLNSVLQRDVDWDEKGFVLARAEIDYLKPVFLRDEIHCLTKTSVLGEKSIVLESCIVRIEQETRVLCASAKAVLVAMNYRELKSIPVPLEWKERFRKFESL